MGVSQLQTWQITRGQPVQALWGRRFAFYVAAKIDVTSKYDFEWENVIDACLHMAWHSLALHDM